MKRLKRYFSSVIAVLMCLTILKNGNLFAGEVIELSLDKAVDIAMENSYRIKQLEMGIERNRYWLEARQASLKSRVYMNLKAPEYKAISDYKWNSELRKDEIIRQNTRLWQMDLAVRQPVLLLGYPTNGYLSLNNRTYKYIQKDGVGDINYYNRYYLKFEQPFFLPNELKNNIEEAELDLEMRELEYIRDRVWLIERVADDYFDLFEFTYNNTIYFNQIENLEKTSVIANKLAQGDSTRVMDKIQVQVELTNVKETLLRNHSDLRRQEAEAKQRLRLSLEDSVYVVPGFLFKPININMEQAVQYGYNLSPTLRVLGINKRKDEIDLNNSKGWDAFHVNLEVTYGLEKQNERHQALWEEYDNSYSTSLNAYVPIWDWGRRKSRIEAEKIGLAQTELRIEENKTEMRSEIILFVENVLEYQQRTKNMMESMDIVQQVTDVSIEQYRTGTISLQDILQIIDRQRETEINFLDTYQGYKRSLLNLMMRTYYDYENDISLIEKFRPNS
ncbi:MAG: TolC family protein [Candidatus Latescibacteria bacterium]|jgi:outer membrane protein|nr:TolC family protein [Candidatus Latescibacterota bacterium]